MEMRRTDLRCFASWMAREHEVVVFPTPPFPPTNIHRSDFWSRIDWSVGAMSASMSAVEAMVEAASIGGGELVVRGVEIRKAGVWVG